MSDTNQTSFDKRISDFTLPFDLQLFPGIKHDLFHGKVKLTFSKKFNFNQKKDVGCFVLDITYFLIFSDFPKYTLRAVTNALNLETSSLAFPVTIRSALKNCYSRNKFIDITDIDNEEGK